MLQVRGFFFFGLLGFESHCVDEVVSDQFFGCKFNVSSFPVSSVLRVFDSKTCIIEEPDAGVHSMYLQANILPFI